MNKAIEEKTEMQDEELYALFDRAFETERLCVSEDLIQKTLKRVAAESDGKVVSFEKAAKRRRSVSAYAGMVAAAVFVLVLGVSAFGDGLWNGGVKKDAVYDKAQRNIKTEATTESKENGVPMTADGEVYYSSTADSVNAESDAVSDRAGVPLEPTACEEKEEKTVGLQSVAVILPERLSTAFSAEGYEATDSVAEVWEFVESRKDWDDEMVSVLETKGFTESKLSTKGRYRYNLTQADGTEKLIGSEVPLELIVRIETKQGVLWSLFGENVSLYPE